MYMGFQSRIIGRALRIRLYALLPILSLCTGSSTLGSYFRPQVHDTSREVSLRGDISS